MSKEIDPATGRSAPDTATSYERAKPAEESPSKSLEQPPTSPPAQADHLADNAAPKSPKHQQNG